MEWFCSICYIKHYNDENIFDMTQQYVQQGRILNCLSH